MMPVALFVLAGALAQAALPDAREDLAKAAEKTRELENYRFKGRISVDGTPFLADPVELSGVYDKEKGFSASMGPFGALFRSGKKAAIKDPDSGAWVHLRLGTKVGEGPHAARIPLIAAGLKPPHEELKKFEGRFKEIRRKDGEEKLGDVSCVVYEGPLTEGGVKSFLPAGVGAMLGKGTYEGTGRAWVADGRIIKFTADAKIQIEDKDGTLDLTVSRTAEIQEIGKAAVEMPAEVRKLFED